MMLTKRNFLEQQPHPRSKISKCIEEVLKSNLPVKAPTLFPLPLQLIRAPTPPSGHIKYICTNVSHQQSIHCMVQIWMCISTNICVQQCEWGEWLSQISGIRSNVKRRCGKSLRVFDDFVWILVYLCVFASLGPSGKMDRSQSQLQE